MKVAILTSSTPSNIWLTNQILAHHEVSALIIESPAPAQTGREKRARRARMIAKHGLTRSVNKLLYNWVRWRVLSGRERHFAREHFFPEGGSMEYLRQVPTIRVNNINDSACIEFLDAHAPDVIAVCGTSIVKPEVYTRSSLGAVNIHTGITPEYRSADPIFWALYNNEPENVGVTIHFVDRGIDTGPIIHQARVPVYRGDTLASISARCIRRGAELYLRALEEIRQGTVRTHDKSHVSGRAYYSIELGIVQYVRFLFRFFRIRRRLPAEPVSTIAKVAEPGR